MLEGPGGNARLLTFPLWKYFCWMEASSPLSSLQELCPNQGPMCCRRRDPSPYSLPHRDLFGLTCSLCSNGAPAGPRVSASSHFCNSCLSLFSTFPSLLSPLFPASLTPTGRHWKLAQMSIRHCWGTAVTEGSEAIQGRQSLPRMTATQELWHLNV